MVKVILEIDTAARAAYIRLSDTPITHTTEVTPDLLADLDEFEMVVGFELLDTKADLPLQTLCERFHVREDVRQLLTSIAPSLKQNIQNPFDTEGDSSGATELTFA